MIYLLTYLFTHSLTYLLTYLLTHSLTPHSTVLLEKLTVSQLVNKFPTFYGTRRFITTFKSAHKLYHSRLDPDHTPTSYFLKLHLNIILPSMPQSPKWTLSLRFPHQNLEYASPLPDMRYMLHPSHLSQFYHPKNIG